MSLPSAEVAADFKDALQDLKINSRPEISNLTIIAKENTEHAQAISHELENHIRTTRPEWKLPALYVLDSIVKNVGTPYTVYLGRNMYRTFMDAYMVMDPGFRKAMEGLLKTWKQPVPESMDPRPVFPAEVTRDIENTLNRIRSIHTQAGQPARPPAQHGLPARPVANPAWRNTPTPPQNGPRYAAPNDPRVRQQLGQFNSPSSTPVQFPPGSSTPQPVSSTDLQNLKSEVAKLITTTQNAFAYNPADVALRTKLQALLQLQKVLETQTLPPQQLEAVRKQIEALSAPPAPTPTPAFAPPPSVPPVIPSPQQAPPAFGSTPAPLDLAKILASVKPAAPPASTPTPTPNPPAPSLAEILRRVSSPAQSSSVPAPTPFNLPPMPPIPAPPTPNLGSISPPAPSGTPLNLAQILAQFNKPGSVPPASQPTPVQPPPAAAPAPGSAEWLLKALQGFPTNGTPSNAGPLGSEAMARQLSAPTNVMNDIELTTASMKKPRFHLISKLYEAYPNICATCGRRFESTPEGREKKARHMDWHFKVKDPEAAKRGVHRSWYISEKEWIDYREIDEASPEQAANGASGGAATVKKQAKDRYVAVPQDAAILHAPCPICQEKFETQWLVEANDFVWMDAIQVGGKVYHATCWEEYSKGAGIVTPGTPDSVLGKRKAEEVEIGGSRAKPW